MGWFGEVMGHSIGTIQYIAYDFLSAFYSNYVLVPFLRYIQIMVGTCRI